MPVVRVVGGLCVVTAPCELLIWEQNGVIASEWTAEGATIEETPVQVAEGLLRMSIIPNSGQVTLRSEASEQREYRLDVPIALSSGYVSLTGLEQAELRREVPAEEVIADFFVAGKWWRTHSASGSRVVLPEFESAETTPLEVLRVQVRDESVRQGAAGVRCSYQTVVF